MKKAIPISIGIALILLLGVGIFLILTNFSQPLSVLRLGGEIVDYKVISSLDNGEYYSFTFQTVQRYPTAWHNSNAVGYGPKLSHNIDEVVGISVNNQDANGDRISIPSFPSVQYNTLYSTNDVQITGLLGNGVGPNGESPNNANTPVGIIYKDLKAECKVVYSSEIGNVVYVHVTGTVVSVDGNIFGLYGSPKIIINCPLYKVGYEPQISVYEFSNNQCSQITIKQSEKTSTDYLTLKECQANIVMLTSSSTQTNTSSTSDNSIKEGFKFSGIWIFLISLVGTLIFLIVVLVIIGRKK